MLTWPRWVSKRRSVPCVIKLTRSPPQIELKAEDLYDKEKVDLETIVIEDVFKLLDCTEEGLTDEEAERRLGIFGPNKLESEEQNAFLQVCRSFPVSQLPGSHGAGDSSSVSCGTRSRGSWRLPPSSPSLSRTVEDAHPTGKISLVSSCSCLPTLPLVSTRNGAPETLSRPSWTRLRPRPRSGAPELGVKSNLQTWFPET